jgi:hypothetical protein
MKPDSLVISNAASILGRRSAQARMEKWGRQEFLRKMREWGAKGGRPKKKEGNNVSLPPW